MVGMPLPIKKILAVVAAVSAMLGTTSTTAEHVITAGPQGDGRGVTPNGWLLTPAGRHIDLADPGWWADRPYGQALSPDGRTLLISSAGQSTQSIKVVDTESGTVRQTIAYKAPQAVNVGVVWSPDGGRAYASAGGNNKVRSYTFDGRALTEGASIAVPGFPMGLAIAPDGQTLYAAENRGDSLAVIDLTTGLVTNIPVGHCDEQGTPVQYPPTAPQCQPYGVALSTDGSTAYVSNWGEHSVTAISTVTRTVVGKIPVGTHPNSLAVNPQPGRHQVVVANGDSDTLSVIDSAANTVVETIDLAPYANAPVGTNPNGLAFAPDGNTVYVANSGNNDVDVVKLVGQSEGDSRSAANGQHGDGNPVVGMIPTAWYPTGISVSPAGDTLYVTNAKGLGAGPNRGYRQGQFGPPDQYAGSMMHGTLQIVGVPDRNQLDKYSKQVAHNNGLQEGNQNDGGVIPGRVGQASPIKHVIYVVKENRTYDQIFGSLGKGNGDPSLNLFGDESAPNTRTLARRFVLLDNFYASAEVSADGWSWSTEANANIYDQRHWPQNYSDVNRGRGYDFEGGNYATAANRNPKDAYLWDRLADAGVAFRNYGFWTVFGSRPPAVTATATAPNLATRTDPFYPGYNLAWADSPLSPMAKPARISEWQREFASYEANPSTFPTVEFLRLPNDHTAGTFPGAPVPRAYVADNDYALGLLVETVSHSQFWKDTAIFVVEDDAQDGPDHVDGHRTEALVISPYTQRGKVDSTLYSTVSMLRTIELIVGIGPMTQFDALATPMLNAFSSRANLAPYTAQIPEQSMSQLNGANAPLASAMKGITTSPADQTPEQVLNQAIWQSVHGGDSSVPAIGGDPTG